jgi:2-amino-4-hydroxy-6-hydroxymethyldihydropteridine diphosphokinase
MTADETAAPVDAFVAIGSNIEPHENIPRAVSALRACCNVVASSTFYKTIPVGRPRDPEYRNGAVHVRTATPPAAFQYGDLRGIERDLGRVRSDDRYAARTIDLDLIIHGDSSGTFDGLTLPALDLFERDFVAIPVAELMPGFEMPGEPATLADIAKKFKASKLEVDRLLTERVKEIVQDE